MKIGNNAWQTRVGRIWNSFNSTDAFKLNWLLKAASNESNKAENNSEKQDSCALPFLLQLCHWTNLFLHPAGLLCSCCWKESSSPKSGTVVSGLLLLTSALLPSLFSACPPTMNALSLGCFWFKEGTVSDYKGNSWVLGYHYCLQVFEYKAFQ